MKRNAVVLLICILSFCITLPSVIRNRDEIHAIILKEKTDKLRLAFDEELKLMSFCEKGVHDAVVSLPHEGQLVEKSPDGNEFIISEEIPLGNPEPLENSKGSIVENEIESSRENARHSAFLFNLMIDGITEDERLSMNAYLNARLSHEDYLKVQEIIGKYERLVTQ